jgi:hypothetical protein
VGGAGNEGGGGTPGEGCEGGGGRAGGASSPHRQNRKKLVVDGASVHSLGLCSPAAAGRTRTHFVFALTSMPGLLSSWLIACSSHSPLPGPAAVQISASSACTSAGESASPSRQVMASSSHGRPTAAHASVQLCPPPPRIHVEGGSEGGGDDGVGSNGGEGGTVGGGGKGGGVGGGGVGPWLGG